MLLLFSVNLLLAGTVPEDAVPKPEHQLYSWWIPVGEVVGLNIGVWAWDRYYLKERYAEIDLETMNTNFRRGFTWDNNHFGINFFGHPYQGSFYFNAARSSGNEFGASLLFTAFGSFQWEMVMEREQPSTNDWITTTFGGAVYGEMLHRLSERIFAKEEWPVAARYASGTILHPMSAVNHGILGKKCSQTAIPLDMSISLGGGRHLVSDYTYQGNDLPREEESWKGKFVGVSLDVQYGDMLHKIKKPFEEFHIWLDHVGDEDGKVIHIESAATLKNMVMHANPHSFGLAWKVNADVIYGQIAEMSSYSTGGSMFFEVYFSPKVRLSMENGGHWVLIGSTDFLYDQALLDADTTSGEVLRTYQMSWGLNYKNASSLTWVGHGRLYGKINLYGFKTMPQSEPHYGAYGVDFVNIAEVGVEADLPWHLSIGSRFDFYWKTGMYKSMLPITRTMNSLGSYVRYSF